MLFYHRCKQIFIKIYLLKYVNIFFYTTPEIFRSIQEIQPECNSNTIKATLYWLIKAILKYFTFFSSVLIIFDTNYLRYYIVQFRCACLLHSIKQ